MALTDTAAAETGPAFALEELTSEARACWAALMHALADIFAAEGRPGGDAAAAALRSVTDAPYRRLDERTDPAMMNVLAETLTDAGAHPAAKAVADAGDLIPWHYSGLSDRRIPASMAHGMQTSYLIGPKDAAVIHPTVYAGLFLQTAELDYPARHHAAEETFFVLSGVAEWRVGESPPAWRAPGEYVFHPSYALHASRTAAAPTLAAWRWTGDIDFKTYELKV